MVFSYLFGSRSNSSDSLQDNDKLIDEKAVVESNKGIGVSLLAPWARYVTAPVTYLSHSYFFKKSSDSDAENQSCNEKADDFVEECKDYHRGIGASIMTPFRQYVVAPAKYLSSSTQFAVIDKSAKEWLFRLDTAHVKGAKYPHINVNYKLTGVRDPHTRIPSAVVTASGPVGKVIRNAGDIVTVAAVAVDIYSIGSTAWKEHEEMGGVGIETGKVAAGVGGAWTAGMVGATVGAKAGSVAGGVIAGPVGAGVLGILGAVSGGIAGSIEGRKKAEQFVEQQAQGRMQKSKL